VCSGPDPGKFRGERWKSVSSGIGLALTAEPSHPSGVISVTNFFRAVKHGWPSPAYDSYLVDSASSHMLVSKIKPCMSKYKQLYRETANGSLNQLSFI
jgi:hypothetical protein